jgi:hypothetical protein
MPSIGFYHPKPEFVEKRAVGSKINKFSSEGEN